MAALSGTPFAASLGEVEGLVGTSTEALLLAWIDADVQPRLICDPALTLIWSNVAAANALATGPVLQLKQGVLAMSDRADQALLGSFVAESNDVLTTCAFSSGTGGYLLLRARRIARTSGLERIGISFVQCTRNFSVRYADIEHVFKLTPAEYRVLMKMTDGLTADAIARSSKLSVETVRSHIRQLYIKIDVVSREALFEKIGAFRL